MRKRFVVRKKQVGRDNNEVTSWQCFEMPGPPPRRVGLGQGQRTDLSI